MRLGHMSEKGHNMLCKWDLLYCQHTGTLEFYEKSVYGKEKMVSFTSAVQKFNGVLNYIYSDLLRYMLSFIDDYSGKVWPLFIKKI